MTNEAVGTPDLTPEQVERVQEWYAKSGARIDQLPLTASITRELSLVFAVNIDENGFMDVSDDDLAAAFYKAIVGLEARIIAIEDRLNRRD